MGHGGKYKRREREGEGEGGEEGERRGGRQKGVDIRSCIHI